MPPDTNTPPKRRLFVVGGEQGPGRGKKGRSGRPREDFLIFLENLRRDPRARKRLERIAWTDPNPERFLRFMMWVTERLDGKPAQPITAEGENVTVTLDIASHA